MTFNKNLQYALKDYRKNFIYVLFVNIILVSCFLFLFFFYVSNVDVLKIFKVRETREQIQNKNVHFLNAFPNLDSPSSPEDNNTSDQLGQLGSIHEDDNYVIVSSYNPINFLEKINFPVKLDETYTEPVLLLGHKYDSDLDTNFQYESKNSGLTINAKTVGSIPESTVILSKKGAINLDNKKLLIINTKDFMIYLQDPFLYWDNIRTADNLNEEMLINLCNDLVRNNICKYAFPLDGSEIIRKIEFNTIGETIGNLFITVYTTVVFLGLNIFLRAVINNSLRTYAVHQIVGASIKDLRVRLLLFLLAIMILPLVILSLLIIPIWLNMRDFNLLSIFIAYLAFCILVYLVNRGQINVNRLNKVIRNFSQ